MRMASLARRVRSSISSSMLLREHVTPYPPTQASGGSVLSIQSHTVHGYVGNKSAVFPLQLLGFEVDPINSVHFTNHTGYPSFGGQILDGKELQSLVDGLKANGLLQQHTHLLTGYIGSESFLNAVLYALRTVKKENPDLIYVCDPVLGDHGKLYVPEGLVNVYKDKVIHQATILTPNQFECELLTGVKIETKRDAIAACNILHSKGIEVVLLTSLEYKGSDLSANRSKALTCLVSRDPSAKNGKAKDDGKTMETYELSIPRLDGYFTGTGDLIASNFLAWYYRYPKDLPLAMEKAIATVQGVIENTLRGIERIPRKGEVPPELKLIQSKKIIENPPIKHRCVPTNDTPLIKAVIFDLDGTLTLPHLIDFKTMRARLGMSSMDGDIIEFCRDESKHTKGEQERLFQIVEEMEMSACGDQTSLQPGVVKMLKALKCNDFKIGLCTRNCEGAVRSFMKTSELEEGFFDLVLTRDAPLFKPDGGIIRHFCEHWNDQVTPSTTIIIGDSPDDALTGKWGGSYVGVVCNDKNAKAQRHADFLFNTMDDISGLLL